MSGDDTIAFQREPASFGLRVWRTEETISTDCLVYRSLVLWLALSHSNQGWVIGAIPLEIRYSFNLLRGSDVARLAAMPSSLVYWKQGFQRSDWETPCHHADLIFQESLVQLWGRRLRCRFHSFHLNGKFPHLSITNEILINYYCFCLLITCSVNRLPSGV